MLSSSCPKPQRCHTRERDACLRQQGMLSRLFGSSWVMGHVQGGGAGTGSLPAPGNVLTAPRQHLPVCCHQQTHGAEAQLCLGPGPAAERELSLFTRRGSQSSWCHAGGVPGSAPSMWAELDVPSWRARPFPAELGAASLSAEFARRRPWPSLGLVTGCPERRGQRSAQHVAARFVHPQPFNYVLFPLAL